MTRRSKVLTGALVALLLAGAVTWFGVRMTPEQRADARAADQILSQDGADDGALGDLDTDMKDLGVSAHDEAEADQILDDLLED